MPAKTPDPSRRNERARRAILDASMSLIDELGYDKVSMQAIAARAGVGKQTIYRWWPSKGMVVLEAATRSLDPVVVYPDTGDIVADMRSQLLGIVELISTTGFGPAYRGLVAAGQSDAVLLGAISQQVIEPNIEAFNARFTLARDHGQIHADADLSTLRDLLYGVIEYRLIHGMPIEPSHIDAVLAVTFAGIR